MNKQITFNIQLTTIRKNSKWENDKHNCQLGTLISFETLTDTHLEITFKVLQPIIKLFPKNTQKEKGSERRR